MSAYPSQCVESAYMTRVTKLIFFICQIPDFVREQCVIKHVCAVYEWSGWMKLPGPSGFCVIVV